MSSEQIPSGEDAKRLPECDLIMKGGITSGLVYPEVVLKLAERYRFARLGGSSAGAIAAALAAAGEYGRRRGNENGGFCHLKQAADELKEDGRLVKLFEPAPSARPLFEILLESFAVREAPVWRRVLIAARAAMRQQPGYTAAAALLFVPLVVLCVAAFKGLHWALAILLALPLAALIAAAVAALSAGRALLRGVKGLEDFGLCPGTGSKDSLLAWLHKGIQESAGLPLTKPLTFRDLREAGIELTLMSTDLNLARPVRVPDDLKGYSFDDTLAKRLPPDDREGHEGRPGRRRPLADAGGGPAGARGGTAQPQLPGPVLRGAAVPRAVVGAASVFGRRNRLELPDPLLRRVVSDAPDVRRRPGGLRGRGGHAR